MKQSNKTSEGKLKISILIWFLKVKENLVATIVSMKQEVIAEIQG